MLQTRPKMCTNPVRTKLLVVLGWVHQRHALNKIQIGRKKTSDGFTLLRHVPECRYMSYERVHRFVPVRKNAASFFLGQPGFDFDMSQTNHN